VTVVAAGQPPALTALDPGRFLHAGQGIELTRPNPASGCGTLVSTIVAVLDKGSDAIVTFETILRCAEDGAEPTGRTRTRVFVRGGGGFGGPRGETTLITRPKRSPDKRVAYASRPEQALLYRLSGDRHRLHSDPPFARERGFEGPILHGLCTYGYACRALIEGAADGNPTRLLAMDARFSRPAYPGQTLTTEIWIDAPDRVSFCTLSDAGETVLDGGTARLTWEACGVHSNT
jgi:acyl dehydratase